LAQTAARLHQTIRDGPLLPEEAPDFALCFRGLRDATGRKSQLQRSTKPTPKLTSIKLKVEFLITSDQEYHCAFNAAQNTSDNKLSEYLPDQFAVD
jgi:hypothetical protein